MAAKSPAKSTATTAKESAPTGQDTGRRSTARRSLVTRDVLEKATLLFAEKGYETTTLQDIAAAVGVSRTALYHYVTSKEELLAMLVEQMSVALADTLAALRAREDLTPEGKLRELTDMLVRQRAESPQQFRVHDQTESALPEPMRSKHRQARRDVLSALSAVIEEGIDRGEFKPLDPNVAAFSVLGMCNWVAWWYHSGPDYDIDAVARQISQSAIDMMAADDATRAPADSAKAALATARSSLDALERLLPTDGA
ncbi:TetR family transcriptional regulator [Catenulispora sp. NF23]|uniref:TetR family transcriptional regulator n=1 Tax=Catenulispora pinistramenti TaxID=2705254 RepID=A0ABS5KQI7_9ACTN|nr:TetR/AcrR family transcriptional regulator [Catenulispora pinistramenti]MBS2531748.1 TetR family transcriptional regulator [Catenulispora pinistramenti]MBS2548313.1 TetR family transcriptional regulator [Catenulispora pinistramenti]